MVVSFRVAACRGPWCPWDGVSATFSTPGNVLSSRDLHLASPLWGDHTTRPTATASGVPLIDGHLRVRHDKIDTNGTLTLRHNRRLHHIGLGRRYAGTSVLVLVHDLHIRVLSTSGRLLADLTLDPARDYQPQAPT